MRPLPPARVRALVARRAGILLDVSLGGTPQARSVSFQDLGRSPLALPWPLPTACAHTAVVTHVLEYLDPATFFRWFDELHRVLRPSGVAFVSGPIGADQSRAWLSDPTHRVRITEDALSWLDPRTPSWRAHAEVGRPTPLPWSLVLFHRVAGTFGTISYNATLEAVRPETVKGLAR